MNAMRILSLAAIVAALSAPAAFGVTTNGIDGSNNPHHVPGESIDSGLGDLPADYTAAEFQRIAALSAPADRRMRTVKPALAVFTIPAKTADAAVVSGNYEVTFESEFPGEKLDSGLGDLPPDYTGAEFQRISAR